MLNWFMVLLLFCIFILIIFESFILKLQIKILILVELSVILFCIVQVSCNCEREKEKWAEDLNRHFWKKTYRWPIGTWKRCSASLITGMQIKTRIQWGTTLHQSEWPRLKNLQMEFSWCAVNKNLSASAGGMGLIPGLGRFHMLRSNLRPRATTAEPEL